MAQCLGLSVFSAVARVQSQVGDLRSCKLGGGGGGGEEAVT